MLGSAAAVSGANSRFDAKRSRKPVPSAAIGDAASWMTIADPLLPVCAMAEAFVGPT